MLLLLVFFSGVLSGFLIHFYFFPQTTCPEIDSTLYPTLEFCARKVYTQAPDGKFMCPNFEICKKTFNQSRRVGAHLSWCCKDRRGPLSSGEQVNRYLIWAWIQNNWDKKMG